MKRRAGRVSILTVLALVAVVAVIAGFVFSGQSVDTAGSRFMDALARGDVERLTSLSVIPGRSTEEVRKEWDFAVNRAGKFYRFGWQIAGADTTGPDRGYVRLKILRNIENPGSYEENFQLPMRKVDGAWKVAVAEISPEMFPALPR